MLSVHAASTARLAGQLCVTTNSLDVLAMLLMASAAVPMLVSVTGRAIERVPKVTEPNPTATCDRPISGAGVLTLVPRKATVAVPVGAFEAMFKVASLLPRVSGLMATVTVQEALAARVALAVQVPPSTNSLLWVPLVAMLPSVRLAAPLLVSVTVLALLVTPTTCDPRSISVALSAMPG